MHLPLGGGQQALFIVAGYAVWLGMLRYACRHGAVAAPTAGTVCQLNRKLFLSAVLGHANHRQAGRIAERRPGFDAARGGSTWPPDSRSPPARP